jgi:hypothetical protein
MAAHTCGVFLLVWLVVLFCLHIWLRGDLEYLWVLFYSLQLVINMKVYESSIPPNVQIFILEIAHVINFDFMNPAYYIRKSYPTFHLGGAKPAVIFSDFQTFSVIDSMEVYIIFALLTLVTWVVLYALSKVFDSVKIKV